MKENINDIHSFPSSGNENWFFQCDLEFFLGFKPFKPDYISLKTLDELIEKDKQREKDGFPRRIKIGRIVKPVAGNRQQVIVVPTTYEPKLYHDDDPTEEQTTGGSGEGEEGEIIARQPLVPREGEGAGQGAGQGEEQEHEILADVEQLGRIITERFNLPNLKNKGRKFSITKYDYDLTDRNREFGQLLDKKATLRQIIKTNIQLGNIDPNEPLSPEDFVINPKDKIFRILSPEKTYEAQAIVFFIRDYSGSMEGKPTEVVVSQHMLIYSWLMYQYQSNVQTRFIVHDTVAKEVPDFYTYYKYQVAGGTYVYPAFELLNSIIENEQLFKDYNIYVFYGTDGDDWESTGERMLQALEKSLFFVNRCGISVVNNGFSSGKTNVEQYIEKSGLLNTKKDLLRLYKFTELSPSEDEIIESIRFLVSE